MKRTVCLLLIIAVLFCSLPTAFSAQGENELTVLFTHDTHDYLYPTETVTYDDKIIEHGGAARLKTLLNQNLNENSIYLDGGDFSMGTLYQAAYSTDAYELRNLGLLDCSVTTLGNHEFDYGADGVADMLHAAMKSGDKLPQIVQSNIDFSGKLTKEQFDLKSAFDEYGVKDYTVLQKAGYKIGVFGLCGLDCIECIQTDLNYKNYIEAAKKTVKALKKENCDIIIALSHSGTDGNGKTGEDIELAKKVNGIDVIISSHSHSFYDTPVIIGETYIVSAGEYLKYLGKLTLKKENGKISVGSYKLLPINSTVTEDADTAKRIELYKAEIGKKYLSNYGVGFDDVICHSSFNLLSLEEMYETHKEYPMGNIIADSYIYEAQRNGINDIDVALVGLGTIRKSIKRGNITVADAFELCSLGVGADKSAGHPIVSAYITGKELKLLTELDASLGTLVSSIKMSYSGLSYEFNTKRIILDRVTDIKLVRKDGSTEKIEDKKLYKVVANMYAINMLGMLNGLTKGVLKITPKDANGNPIKDFYKYALKGTDGNDIKEWVALKNFLGSFDPNQEGIAELPSCYQGDLSRKIKTAKTGFKEMAKRGEGTRLMPTVINVAVLILSIIIAVTVWLIIRRNRRKKQQKNKTK